MMDELAWHQRPWEAEACGWQGQLVTEFLMLTTGQSVDQPVQSPKRKQLTCTRSAFLSNVAVHREPVLRRAMVSEAAAVEPRPRRRGLSWRRTARQSTRIRQDALGAQPVAVAAGAGAWLPAVCSIMVMMAVPFPG